MRPEKMMQRRNGPAENRHAIGPARTGGVISAGIGYYVEKEFSSTASLIVFLTLFFSNFAVSWIAVILAIDGSLKNAQGAQEQLDIEKAGRAGIASREATASAARAAKTVAAAPNARPAG